VRSPEKQQNIRPVQGSSQRTPRTHKTRPPNQRVTTTPGASTEAQINVCDSPNVVAREEVGRKEKAMKPTLILYSEDPLTMDEEKEIRNVIRRMNKKRSSTNKMKLLSEMRTENRVKRSRELLLRGIHNLFQPKDQTNGIR
jgi:hypothetical protein